MTAGRLARLTLMVAGTVVFLYLMTQLSSVPMAQGVSEGALLRLSWKAVPERIEVCRELSEEELAKLAEHMRQRVRCDGRFATYTLRVEVDERAVHEGIVRGAGLRNDRPMFLLHEIGMNPGEHRLRVTFARREKTIGDSTAHMRVGADTGLYPGRAEREVVERERRAQAAIPSYVELDTMLTFLPERALVVSFDAERRMFQVLSELPR